jgi:uncharacterized integral membrane protein
MNKEFRERLFEFCKEAYFFQFDRREKISGRTGVLLAIVAIAVNIALKYLEEFPTFDGSFCAIFFVSLLGIALILGVVALYNIIRALVWTVKWKYVPSPQPIVQHIEELEARNKNLGPERAVDLREVFEMNLIRQFAEAATANDLNNYTKTRHLAYAIAWAIATVVALIFCAGPFYCLKFKMGRPAQKIEIVKPIPKNQ